MVCSKVQNISIICFGTIDLVKCNINKQKLKVTAKLLKFFLNQKVFLKSTYYFLGSLKICLCRTLTTNC